MLFDNSEQLEVRHVISLAHYSVDVYAGGENISEGEIWIKRNCIRLTKKPVDEDAPTSSAPFYLFSDNCSEKEDFYHALLHNQEQASNIQPRPPKPQLFRTDDMIKLIRQLHTSEENSQVRWLNAIIGRLFLGLYQTAGMEEFISSKITKKMARVSKPAFITSLKMKEVDLGDSAPIFTNPKLREMTVDGALVVEADVKYNGNFKLVIAAVARIDLGSRFKAREVNMILAGILKKLEGHVLFKFKPPPSNRLWVSFEAMPKLDILLEPIVSSRQITYGVILRAIESRLREVVGETLVLPNWDDIPFTDTQTLPFRGGVWKTGDGNAHDIVTKRNDLLDGQTDDDPAASVNEELKSPAEPSLASSAPNLVDTNISEMSPILALTTPFPNVTKTSSILASATQPSLVEKPKPLRSNSFAVAASPIVSNNPATIDAAGHQANKGQRDAASAMKTLSSRSPETTPVGSPSKDNDRLRRMEMANQESKQSRPSSREQRRASENGTYVGISGLHAEETEHGNGSRDTAQSSRESTRQSSTAPTQDDTPCNPPETKTSADKARSVNQSIGSATAVAKSWGLGMLQRQQGQPFNLSARRRENSIGSQPIGRGQPLPPPGQPLPKPEKDVWPTVAFGSLRRKPVPQPGSSGSSLLAAERAAPTSKPGEYQHQRQTSVSSTDVVMTVDAPRGPAEKYRVSANGTGSSNKSAPINNATSLSFPTSTTQPSSDPGATSAGTHWSSSPAVNSEEPAPAANAKKFKTRSISSPCPGELSNGTDGSASPDNLLESDVSK